MRIIAIANQKGGVGKTTTAINLSAGLAARGYRCLVVDLDPQANATSGLGVAQEEGVSLYPVLTGYGAAYDMVRATKVENLWILPSNEELAGAEFELAQSGDHLGRMRNALLPLKQRPGIDFVVLDCPPSLGILMTSALAAADEVLVPLQCEYFGLEGLSRIVSVVRRIQTTANPDMRLEGIVMTMFDSRTTLSQDVVRDVKQYFGDVVYQTIIPRTVRLGEAPSHGKTILQYDASGRGSQAYQALALEFLKRRKMPSRKRSSSSAS